MRLLPSSSIALGVAWLLAAATASAQTPRPERPYRGLFGNGGGAGTAQQAVIASGSVGASVDDNLVADALGITGKGTSAGRGDRGLVGLFSGRLSSFFNFDRVTVTAIAATNVRYYPSFAGERYVRRYNAVVGTSVRLARPLSVHGAISYQPQSLGSLFPALYERGDGVDSPDLDFVVRQQHFVAYTGGADLVQRLSRRMSFGASYSVRKSESALSRRPFIGQHARAGLTLNVGKGLNLRAGYAYTEGRYTGDSRRVANQAIDAGVGYDRQLSFSRRTTLSFATGTAATRRRDHLQYFATGAARLNREIGRTWNASVAYNRNVRFVETFDDAVFGDALTLGFGGLVNRRVELRSSAYAATGSVGSVGPNREFAAYYATTGLTIALSRNVALTANYSYSAYRFDADLTLPPGWAHDVHRQRIEGNLNLWAPLFERARRGDASR